MDFFWFDGLFFLYRFSFCEKVLLLKQWKFGVGGGAVEEPAAASLGLDYAGVDILEENGKLFLCEVNSNAFFSGIERATGKNVAAMYAEHIVKNIRK